MKIGDFNTGTNKSSCIGFLSKFYPRYYQYREIKKEMKVVPKYNNFNIAYILVAFFLNFEKKHSSFSFYVLV